MEVIKIKGIITTIIITIIFLILFIIYGFGIITSILSIKGNFFTNAIFFVVIGLLVFFIISLIITMFNRIKEIKKEEKDDLSKY
ncbi:hypothetical protein OSSY52_05720 [Tepiditoga spiralis]|uniref:Uncharacterized protein n=1 Tax=Tepiditoga spiralis TaxID=2108365 RepID=A0A7G1G292_9BACT|nr:hypothetical protein OSSY52_05720 [Tepiditoga spiralis]